MRRRNFMTVVACAAAYPLLAGAQQKPMPAIGKAEPGSRVPIVGVLLNEPPEPAFAAFLEKFHELGYEEGRNVRLEIRSADAKSERLPGLAEELVQMKADVIISAFSPPTRAAIDATKQIPIVMASVDPLVGGFVTNLSHPGGNVTGVASFTCETAAKRLQMLKDAVPTVSRIAVLRNPDGGTAAGAVCNGQETERAAQQTGVEVRFFLLRADDDPVPAFKEMIDWRADALLHTPSGVAPWVEAMIAFAAERRLPTMVAQRHWVEAGGLMTYVPDRPEMYRRVAVHVDKILKGANPGDIPVELPTRYELVVNLKTADALGITIPPAILVRADHVIE
jgi:putative tryptophan/tyrosine transport system substrate-binding protein